MKAAYLIPVLAIATLALGACSKSTSSTSSSAQPSAAASAPMSAPASSSTGSSADHPDTDGSDPSMTSNTIVNHAQ